MGLYFRRRIPIRGRRVWANASTSGVSISLRLGPLVLNSRSGLSLRLGRGWGFRAR